MKTTEWFDIGQALIGAALIAATVLLCGGCATAYKVSSHNQRVSALRVASDGGGGMRVGVDVEKLTTGYWGAWKEDALGMAAVHVVDGLACYALFAAYEQGKEPDTRIEQPKIPTISNGDGGIVIINQGGTTSYSTQDSHDAAPEE